jgi:hypothetical protein
MKQFAETINWTDPFYEEEGFFKNPSMEEMILRSSCLSREHPSTALG